MLSKFAMIACHAQSSFESGIKGNCIASSELYPYTNGQSIYGLPKIQTCVPIAYRYSGGSKHDLYYMYRDSVAKYVYTGSQM